MSLESVILGEKQQLSITVFRSLAGVLGGQSFVKIVWDRPRNEVHFIQNAQYQFHAYYVGEKILSQHRADIDRDIDAFNASVYFSKDRRFYFGILAFHERKDPNFFTLETVEVDTMDASMLCDFYDVVRARLEAGGALLLRPANLGQQQAVNKIDAKRLPRIFSHELFSGLTFISLNPGTVKGRLRFFASEDTYRLGRQTLEWFDIIVMSRVPDDIPRLSGIISSHRTTPLSHVNVLASGWQIPNCVQTNIVEKVTSEKLDGQWVEMEVNPMSSEVSLKIIERPQETFQKPKWQVQRIRIEEPEVLPTAIASLTQLRMSDRYRYGTKAANLGEIHYVVANGSPRLTGFYRVNRPPRENLMPYLAQFLGLQPGTDLTAAANRFVASAFKIPRGIAVPFSVQSRFLERSSKIQQAIGKLKMALELESKSIDALCLDLQQMIYATRFPSDIRDEIDGAIAQNLAGVRNFVVRSSSNAEDLDQFSAAGIYESFNHVSNAEKIFDSLKHVWASLLSPRSVKLRQEVGISLDDSYMGVIIQEEVVSQFGGVMVTTNPTKKADFRDVYFNVSRKSVKDVVEGGSQPLQCLFNTVEGGGQTLSLDSEGQGLSETESQLLQNLALAGRLLQSHFAPDYTFESPVDCEWLVNDGKVYLLQLRPFSHS